MKRLLFILLTLFTLQSFAQDSIYVKVRTGIPGAYNIALNSTGDSLTWYVSGVRHTVAMAPVLSVAGKTGAVTLTKTDVGLSNVDNTSDISKPISTAVQTALNLKANDNAVVHLAGSPETITSTKTFAGSGNKLINIWQTDPLAAGKISQFTLVNGSTNFGANDRSYQITNTGYSATSSDFTIQYWDGSTYNTRLIIKNNGFTGLNGSVSPSAPLEIRGQSVANNSLFLTTNSYSFGASGSLLRIGHGASSGNTYAIIENLTTGGTTSGNLSIQQGGGNTGFGLTNPTALVHIKAGTATAGTAPLKFTAGVNLTTPENGAVEFNGTHYYGTIGTTRYQLDQQASSMDTVKSIAALIAYSGSAYSMQVIDSLQGGIFYYTTTGTADNGITFAATGKGSGYWVRNYEKTKGVNVDWWGLPRNESNINKAIATAGVNGTVNFSGSGVYVTSGPIAPMDGQVLNGNGCTIQRIADSIVTLTSAINTTDSSFTVNAVPSTWTGGQFQFFSDSTNTNQSSSAFFISRSGNTIKVNGQIGKAWAANTTFVRKIFTMVSSSSTNKIQINNINFDGNKVNTSANHSWTVNNTITASGIGGTTILNKCKFYNIPNENIEGHGIHVTDCYAHNLNGSFIHLSASWVTNGTNNIPSIISGNVTDSTNQISTTVSGHSEGVITNSFTSGYVTINGNRFKNGKDAVFGYIQNTTASSDGKYRNVIIEDNYAEGFTNIFSSISGNSTTDSIRTGHIYVSGNLFNRCGINDWTSAQAGVDLNLDTVMIGANLLVGGTVWNVPVQNSDATQRYILNNPTTTAQGGNINITGTIKGSNIITITTGSAAPTITPAKIGDEFLDLTNKKYYKAFGTSSSSDWIIQN